MSNSSSRRKRRPDQKITNTQRVTLGTVTGFVLIVIVLLAQYVLGIDVLNEEEGTGTATPVINLTAIAELPPAGNMVSIPGGYDGGWFQIYFTSPINTTDSSRFTDSPLENALITTINGAQTSIDAAVFELNSEPVTQALIQAHERGVMVRVVTDGEHGLESPDGTVEELEFADIPVVSDGNRGGFMHNKFFVIDSLYVWTGSTNITHNGIYNNNNNAMLIRSTRLAQNYSAEFQELFEGSFGTTSPNTVPNPSITIEGTVIETVFESEGDLPSKLVALIENAHSVRFMAFSLTRDDLMEPMIRRAQSGELDVMGIVETSQRRFVKDMFCAGLPVRQDGNPDILHHKVFIIDESIVVMGSFNFSNNAANDNDENSLIIYNRDIAQAYLNEFDRRWAEAENPPDDAFDC
ncbi:MAG: hypothetical protein JW966_07465 [Anaerolineae bacterium]|nr:hypothetical protein [Anaerolineae bacterium]